jgi:hypothetical protein
MSERDAIEIRSYRTVFELDRRIYRIDRLRLNPSGVPVRGLLYLLALLALEALVARLPAIGSLAHMVPWYLRDIAIPAGLAALFTVIRIDGRPFHLAARALVRHRLTGARVARLGCSAAPGARWWPPPIVLLPDGSDRQMRRMRFTGPGVARLAVAHERIEWRPGAASRLLRRPDLAVRGLTPARPLARAVILELGAGARLAVDRAATPRRSDREPGPVRWTVGRRRS